MIMSGAIPIESSISLNWLVNKEENPKGSLLDGLLKDTE